MRNQMFYLLNLSQKALCQTWYAMCFLLSIFQANAAFSGTHVGVAGATIPPGQDLTYTNWVQNTGSYAWLAGSSPAWVHVIYASDCSWTPAGGWSSRTYYHWTSVSSSTTASDTSTFDAANLPTTPGTYTFWVYAYYPTDYAGNYSLMSGSPKQVTFTISTPISVTVQPNPSGRSFAVDGTNYTTAQVFSWVPSSSHTIATTSPQSGGTGIQYVYWSWSDGGALSHTVSPAAGTTYTANFTTQYYLTMNASTGGSPSPASAWQNSGAVVPITGNTNSGYIFNNWTGTGTGAYTGANNPASVTMNGAITETANFILPPKLKNIVSGGNLVISWPTNVLGFTLKSNNVPTGSGSWSTVTANPPIVSTNYQVTITPMGDMRFFRLEK